MNANGDRADHHGEETTLGGATVRASALDLYLPKIREPNEKDLITLFEFEILDVIEGRPN